MQNSLKFLALATLSLGTISALAQVSPDSNSKTAPTEASSASGSGASQGSQTSKDSVSTTTAKQTEERNESTRSVVQSNAADDLKTTRDIKSALKDDASLSAKAKRARVVTTANGEVYVWGKVKDQAEENRVLEIVKPLVGNRTLKVKLKLPLGDKPTQNK